MNEAVTDTGPPLHLNQINKMPVLEIFEVISVSKQVKEELQELGAWNQIKNIQEINLQEESVSDDKIIEAGKRVPGYKLQKADLSVLALLHAFKNTLALTDDLDLRRAIESLDREVVGSVGVLIRGYKEGKLSKVELQKSVEQLFNDSSLYLSRAFRLRVLKLIDGLL